MQRTKHELRLASCDGYNRVLRGRHFTHFEVVNGEDRQSNANVGWGNANDCFSHSVITKVLPDGKVKV